MLVDNFKCYAGWNRKDVVLGHTAYVYTALEVMNLGYMLYVSSTVKRVNGHLLISTLAKDWLDDADDKPLAISLIPIWFAQ